MNKCAGYYVFDYLAAQLIKYRATKWKRDTLTSAILNKEQLAKYKAEGISDYDIGLMHGVSANAVIGLRRTYGILTSTKLTWNRQKEMK